jgi:soluble cytochrome b562
VESHKILFESLDKAEKHFEAGEIRLAQKLVNEVSRSMKAEGKVSNKLRHRFNFMSAQSRYFNDISSFATNPKRNEIIVEVEALIAQPHENPKKQANEIHALQTKWQLLDQTSKPAGREQWVTFKNLTDKAWEPCAQYYEELKAIKISNAQQREKIIQTLIQYTNDNSDKWPGLIEMSKFLSKTFQNWQSYAPVLDEDFSKLKTAYQDARKPINNAIKDQENKNYKIKESLIEKVKLINDEDTHTCIQKFKKIKRNYQETGPAGKKNEPILWKRLNESADRFFEADKAILNNELEVIKGLTAELQSEDSSIKDIKNTVSELNKTRKSPEFKNLQKAIKAFENKKIDKINADKIKIYQDLITLLETADENHLSIHNEIFKALKKPLYAGDKNQLHEYTVKFELIAKIDPPEADKAIKQKLALQMLQDKFSGTKNTNDEIKDLLIGFINNLKSKKISAAETKLWKRVCEAMQKLANQLP